MEDRLIGLRELSEIVGRPQRTLGEWRNRQKVIPDTELHVDRRGTLIWRASHVLAVLAEAGRYTGPVPEQMPLPDLVSYLYLEERTGKDRRAVHWMRDPKHPSPLPEPSHMVGGAPLWPRAVVDEWLAAQEVPV